MPISSRFSAHQALIIPDIRIRSIGEVAVESIDAEVYRRFPVPNSLARPLLFRKGPPSTGGLIDRYLDQIETLKKPNTFCKYYAVLKRFAKHFAGQTKDVGEETVIYVGNVYKYYVAYRLTADQRKLRGLPGL